MFIRCTTTRNKDGQRYATYRLVRSQRIDGRVRQVTLLNLGSHFAIERDQWPLLCTRLRQLSEGENGLELETVPAPVEAEAQHLAAQLLAQQPATPELASTGEGSAEPSGDVQSLDVDSLALTRPRSVGVEQLGLWAMEQVDFDGLLAEVGLNGRQRSAAIASIIARMAAPGSEQATHRWLAGHSALGELLDVDFEAMDAMALYRASDRLVQGRASLESALFDRVRDLFALEEVVTLYDLTNTYFEGETAGNAQAQRGHSKEKRSDCPLVTLALVLDASGFVRRSDVFAGNAGEAATLEGMLTGLGAPTGALVVMDRGVASEANLAWLAEAGYRYIVVSRRRHGAIDPQQAETLQTAAGETIHLQAQASPDGEEHYLYCQSERRARKEQAIEQRLQQRFEAELQRIHDGLSRPRTTKRLDKLWQRIGRLKEKYRGVGQHYHIELVADDTGHKARALHWQRQPKAATRATDAGVYCLRTNETGWDAERLWRTYIMLTDLESVLRTLKSELGLRPIYHHKQARTEGHLFITVLAYQFVQIIRRQLTEQGISDSWRGLRDTLSPQRRVTATFNRADGRTLHVRKTTRAEPGQRAIYDALAIDPAPGGIRKMVV
jgi:transposase